MLRTLPLALLLTLLTTSLVHAKPKLPDMVAPLPDIEEMLTQAGWTMTPEMSAKFSRPGDILDAKNTTLVDGADCFTAEVKEGAFAKMEVTRSMSAGVRMRIQVVGVRGGVALEKKIIFDTPIFRQISRFKLVPSAQCVGFLRAAEQRGEDTSGWYVITESLSAVIQQQQCGEYNAKAGTFLVSADASVTQACAQTSLEPVAVAYKTMPAAVLLQQAGPQAIAPAAPAAAPAAPIAIGPITETGQAEVEVGGDVDFAELARRAAQAKAVRESKETALAAEAARLAAERARLAEQERIAAAALEVAQRQRIAAAKQDLLAKAAADLQQIQPLLDMELSDETRPVLQSYLKKWSTTKIRVDGLEESVVIPGVAIVQQALGGAASGGSNSIGMKFVPIAAGSFQMGSPSSEKDREDDETQHRVRLTKSFLMATTEVTQGQWQAVMGSNPSKKDYKGVSLIGTTLPVQNISWFDAVKFANALSKKEGLRAAYRISGKSVGWYLSANGYRLPTEAEWEYAARGGQRGLYAGASSEGSLCTVANIADRQAKRKFSGWTTASCDDGHVGTAPVGSFKPNAWGLYDMSGNVWEWCWDRYDQNYGHHPETDPVGPRSGGNRVFRGGSWFDKPADARVANRYRNTLGNRNKLLGLRLVRTNP
jgi:formylglycine-generating enzyme required for sulfatase activity